MSDLAVSKDLVKSLMKLLNTVWQRFKSDQKSALDSMLETDAKKNRLAQNLAISKKFLANHYEIWLN